MGMVAVDEDGFLLAELRPARAAMLAHGAALVMVHHDALANPRHLLADLGADRRDDPARLRTADDRVRVDGKAADRLATRFWPAILVQIAAAHPRGLHLDNDLAGARGRVRKLHQLDFAPAREDYAAHRFLRLSSRLKNQPTLFRPAARQPLTRARRPCCPRRRSAASRLRWRAVNQRPKRRP